MPVPFWPLAMRQQPQRGSWTGGPQDTRVQFKPEYGPPVVRRRTTAETEIYQGMFPNLSDTMRAALRSFWVDDLAGGVLSFCWRDPVSGDPAMWRIIGAGERAFDLAAKGAGLHDLTVQMMRLPGSPWWASYVPAGRNAVPLLALDFVNGRYGRPAARESLAGLTSFSRASSGTFVGLTGLVQTAAAGVARIDANGLLLEPTRTNLIRHSEEIDNAAWSKSGVTVTANAIVAPDGATTADLVTKSSADSTTPAQAFAVVPGKYFKSVYLKKDTATWVRLRVDLLPDGGGSASAWFNLDTGLFGTIQAGVTDASVTPLADGWYRVSLARTFTGSGNTTLGISPVTADNGLTGSGSVYIWGAQGEAGTTLTSYIPTVAATAARAVDAMTITPAVPSCDLRIINRVGAVTDVLGTSIAAASWPAAAASGARQVLAFPAGALAP